MLTPLSKPFWDDPQKGSWILDRSLMRRPGYPDELIGTLLLLASEAGSFITGPDAVRRRGGWLAGHALVRALPSRPAIEGVRTRVPAHNRRPASKSQFKLR